MNVIKYPLSTEKSIRMMESDNILAFVVERKAKKPEIKKELEGMFKVKILSVRTLILPTGKKKAYIKLSPETPAIDIATQLGMI